MKIPYNKIIINTQNLLGLETAITDSFSKNYLIIRNLWKLFNKELNKANRIKQNNWIKFGVTSKIKNNYHYAAAVAKEIIISTKHNFKDIKIPSGIYIEFNHTGKMSDLKNSYNMIYKENLNHIIREEETLKNHNILHFEKYDRNFNWNHPDSKIKILLPIKLDI